MAASAAVVVAASRLVERAGPFLGAMIATLPISAGPAYVFLAAEQGPAFIAQSSLASLAVNAATAMFILVYVRLARRGMPVSLTAALLAWLAVAAIVTQISWGLLGAAAVNAVAFAGCLLLTRHGVLVPPSRLSAPQRRWDIPARAVGVMLVVAAVVVAARTLGPKVAGVAALFPVVLTSLAAVLHPRLGGAATAAVLVNAVPGMLGFTVGLAVLHVSAVPLGSAAALTLALGVCVSWNLALIVLRRLRTARLSLQTRAPGRMLFGNEH